MILDGIRKQVAYRKLWAPKVVTIDHALSFDERLAAGNYVRIDPDITEEHFPAQQGPWLKKAEQREIRFFHSKKLILLTEAIAKMKGFPLGGIKEFLAIGEQYPDLSPIICVGAVWQYPFNHSIPTSGGQYITVHDIISAIPCIYRVGGKRELGLQRFICPSEKRQLDPGWYFPAIFRTLPIS